MRCAAHIFRAARRSIILVLLLSMTALTFGQVRPIDVLNPKLKADEAQYLPQLQSLQQSIKTTRLPFTFQLARYLNAKSGQRAASNPNGIEFVYFEGREILKISGIYKAAFNAELLSKNERASRTFQDVVVPILRLVSQQIPVNMDCDGIGFEIVYNTRDANSAYDYEGQESLTAVFDRKDAFAYAHASGNTERQQILNRSDIFVDGKDYGLALGQRDPLNIQTLERSVPRQVREPSSGQPASIAPTSAVSVSPSKPAVNSASTSVDAIRLQAQFQPQLNTIMKEYGAKLHLAPSAQPAFEIYADQTVLHLTLQNTLSFDRSTTSIYKRAAQSFDLFLAPDLKGLLQKLPISAKYNTLDLSVLNRIGAETTPSETIDYICPLNSIRSFDEDKITSQDLIDQSEVLVNGVRIALNLQLVE